MSKKYHYFYINNADNKTEEFKNEEEFFESLFWNRDIAEEYGDEPPTEEELTAYFNQDEDDLYDDVNDSWFVKTTRNKKELKELYL